MKTLKIVLPATLVIASLVGLSLTIKPQPQSRYVIQPDIPAPVQPIRSKESKPSPTSGVPTTSQAPTETTDGNNLGRTSPRVGDPCAEWYDDFLLAGWDESEWDTAKWIIYRESRCQQDAFNGYDAGLLQINQFHQPRVESYGLRFPDDLFHGETNLWVAYTLWLDYGWEPWIYKGVIPGGDND